MGIVGLLNEANIQTLLTGVTAAATVALGYFTLVLARETKRLSKATVQPHVVATLELNAWAIHYFDLVVTNTGNAAAHEITIVFEPPLPPVDIRTKDGPPPLRNISVLRPGQSISSNVSEFSKVRGKTFKVIISWKRHPKATDPEVLSYQLAMADYEGIAYLGARSPFIQIAEQIKKLREDWQVVASGGRKIRADVFTSQDRARDEEEWDAHYQEMTKGRKSNPAPKDEKDEPQ